MSELDSVVGMIEAKQPLYCDSSEASITAYLKPGPVSGGHAQRIALCRALLNDPRSLLVDEPTGNFDPASAIIVIDAMHAQAHSGATLVVTTHDPSLVACCDRMIEL